MALSHAPILISLYYALDFIILSFASEHTLADVLMQKKNKNTEHPTTFFSRTIRHAALKYNIIEKQALELVKALKDFQVYIIHSHVIAYVPSVVVKDVLTQNDPEGRCGKWIDAMLEYGLEIKPTKMIKGQGLKRLMVDSNLHALDINFIAALSEKKEAETLPEVSENFSSLPW